MDDAEAKLFVYRAQYLRGEHAYAKEAFEKLDAALMRTKLDGFARVEAFRTKTPVLVVTLPAEFEWRARLVFGDGHPVLRVVLYRDGIELEKRATDYTLPLEFNGEAFVGPIDESIARLEGYPYRRTDPVRVVLETLLEHVLEVKPPASS